MSLYIMYRDIGKLRVSPSCIETLVSLGFPQRHVILHAILVAYKKYCQLIKSELNSKTSQHHQSPWNIQVILEIQMKSVQCTNLNCLCCPGLQPRSAVTNPITARRNTPNQNHHELSNEEHRLHHYYIHAGIVG